MMTYVPAEVAIARQAFRTALELEPPIEQHQAPIEEHPRSERTEHPLIGRWTLVDGVLAREWTH
jgi:hypothetical protein